MKVSYATGDEINNQTPVNLSIYNLRANFRKCCHWNGSPSNFSVTKSIDPVTKQVTYSPSPQSTTKCTLADASPWWSAGTPQNPSKFPCNGCKPECPYYTGPTWQYCIDSKMETGDRVSAVQILELRYYSKDWWKKSDPLSEWNAAFKTTHIWAWSGEFDYDGDLEDYDLEKAPMLQKVYVNSFTSEVFSFSIDPPVPADRGAYIEDDVPDYPSLVWELENTFAGLRVLWPETSSGQPFTFNTFRIGQNTAWVIVYVPDEGELRAVNVTKHSQGSFSNSEFINFMQQSYPEDLFSVSVTDSQAGVVFIPIDLEYGIPHGGGVFNNIKLFYTPAGSSTVDSQSVYFMHVFHHGMIAQTRADDLAGVKTFEPIITSFQEVLMESTIWHLTDNTSVGQVLVESFPAGKRSIYETEDIVEKSLVTGWTPIDCKLVVIPIADKRVSHVTPWAITGACRGVALGVYVNRSGNPKVPKGTGEIKLDIYYQGNDGQYLPGNYFVAVIPQSLNSQPPLDPSYDHIYVTYSLTEYHQAPVEASDVHKLKYPERVSQYATATANVLGVNVDTISIKAPVISVVNDSAQLYITVSDFEGLRESLITLLKRNESHSVQSFNGGGQYDSDIDTHEELFTQIKETFDGKYNGYTFEDTGESVTLEKVCDRFSNLKNYDSDYKVIVVFKDYDGRPVGVKRAYMLLQSAVVQTRDVEIYYKWRMQRQFWLIVDQYWNLARFAEPMSPGSPNGVEIYEPKCGDHNHQTSKDTVYSAYEYGDSGPMWYPYNRCLLPTYHRTTMYDAVKCTANVEGFSNDAPYYGKRFSYWERMRGPDVFKSVILFPILDLGCYYRSVDGNWQAIGEQAFIGYTKIRSTHPNGPYGKDRESLRLSRHYRKRNLKVRTETDASTENALVNDNYTDEFSDILYGTSGDVEVGENSELPVWTHINDTVSEVSRTTDKAQHPFSHYVIEHTGSYPVTETFSLDRKKLSEVIEERDLTQPGSSIEVPISTSFSMVEGVEEVGDTIWVYKELNTSWAWLEIAKDVVRGAPSVNGIHLFNPTTAVWRTDLESATFMDEGTNELHYYAPIFDKETGAVKTRPYVTLNSGPAQNIDWDNDIFIAGPEYDSALQNTAGGTSEPFQLFGLGLQSASFLADNSGIHRYVRGSSGNDLLYGRTFRGLSLSSSVHTNALPYELRDLKAYRPDLFVLVEKKMAGSPIKTFSFILEGNKYIERIEVEYKFGGEYDMPSVGVFYVTPTVPVTNIASSSYRSDKKESETYTIGRKCSGILFQFGNTRSERLSGLQDIRVWYREPVDCVEYISTYERKVNVSTASLGNTDYRDKLYYYSSVFLDTGSSINDSGSLSFVGRNIKDVIIEYEFYDPRGTRFGGYRSELNPENVTGYETDIDGVSFIEGPIQIHTKGRTLLTGEHKIDVLDGYVSSNEDAGCADLVGENKLHEEAQDALYEEAKALSKGSADTVYRWFWHPDELSFFRDTLGIQDFEARFTTTLTLRSTVIPLRRIWADDNFMCTANGSSPHSDGTLHYIGKWQAFGHWIYAGNPLFNEVCWDVILFKIEKHIGEETYGTNEYNNLKMNPQFPWDTPRDKEYYYQRGMIQDRSTYWGGSMGGPGTGAMGVLGGVLDSTVLGPPGPGQAEVESEIEHDREEWSNGKWKEDEQPIR
jgi:hypothetical protein